MKSRNLVILLVGLFCLSIPRIANAQGGGGFVIWEITMPTQEPTQNFMDNIDINVSGTGTPVGQKYKVEIEGPKEGGGFKVYATLEKTVQAGQVWSGKFEVKYQPGKNGGLLLAICKDRK